MISVILLMAGSGQRMKINKNKILLDLYGKPIFMHSLDLFKSYDFEIVCVINENDKDEVIPYLNGIKYVVGGKTRKESVYNGLKAISGDYVIIHDAARPLLSKEVLDNILSIYKDSDAILTYHPCKNTIKLIENNKLKTLNRDNLINALTPQCAKYDLLYNAYKKSFEDNKEFTDDISLIEYYYSDKKIDLVLGNDELIKVTTLIDYKLLKSLKE